MADFDDRVRAGLTAATAPEVPVDRDEVAAILARGESASRRSAGATSSTRRALVGVAAALALVAVGWWASDPGPHQVVTAGDPARVADGWAGWSPGWHEVGPGPVPVTGDVSLARLGDDLVVVTSATVGPDGPVEAGAWSFDLVERTWEALPVPPFDELDAVATDHGLVAVGPDRGSGEASWATWAQGDDDWVVRGPVPKAPTASLAGGGAPGTGVSRLVWTGRRVLDIALGAVLSPATGEVEPLALPEDPASYAHLATATPVWTGERVVLTTWGRQPGLSWDAVGRGLASVPAPPSAPTVGAASSAFSVDGWVALVANLDGGRVALLDPTATSWTDAGPTARTAEPGCLYQVAAVARRLVVGACSERGEGLRARSAAIAPVPRRGEPTADGGALAWQTIDRRPRTERGTETWLGADDALVVWSGALDTAPNPGDPDGGLAVWVPPDD